jgi:ubiquinone/menaquinone biosynthesis C-methylase UbiE
MTTHLVPAANPSTVLIEGRGFGNYAEQYKKGRKEYQEEVVQLCSSLVDNKRGPVLDLGAGTGISTRQLRKRFLYTTGCDVDTRMIESARSVISEHISYKIAPAQKLPFKNHKFRLVTSFASFHWMTKTAEEATATMKEIKRVLVPGGVFFVVIKRNPPSYQTSALEILKKYQQKTQKVEKPIQTAVHFQSILKKFKLQGVTLKNFDTTESHTLEEAVAHCQSLTRWDLLSPDDQPRALQEIRACYEKQLIDQKAIGKSDELLSRNVETFVVYGKTPKQREKIITRATAPGYRLRSRFAACN